MRYLPSQLSKSDRQKQIRLLRKSQKMYKQGKYYVRPNVASFRNRRSNHLQVAEEMYGITPIRPNPALSKATGCSVAALEKIVEKGEGAYYSSGSRPNQTAQSWGLARLGSAITGAKSSAVDFSILEKGCDRRKSKAYRLAKRSLKKYNYGRRHTKRVRV